MASEKNITMRQYNGVDYDTLYPKTKVEQVEGLSANYYNKSEILSDSTKSLYGLNINDVPDSVLSKIYYAMYGTNEVIYRWKREKDAYQEQQSSSASTIEHFLYRPDLSYQNWFYIAYSNTVIINSNGTLTLNNPTTLKIVWGTSNAKISPLANKYFIITSYSHSPTASDYANITSCYKFTSPVSVRESEDDDNDGYVYIDSAYTITTANVHVVETVSSTNPSAYPIDGDGWTYTSLSNVPSSPGFNKAEIGNYTGTGSYGQSNPNEITFTGVPKLVIVSQNSLLPASVSAWQNSFIWFTDTTTSQVYVPNNNTPVYFSQENNSLKWYSNTVSNQLNTSNKIYHYIAITM